MSCHLKCGNCDSGERMYYCIDKNDFVINEENSAVVVKEERNHWKKGDPEYETRRRSSRKGDDLQKIG